MSSEDPFGDVRSVLQEEPGALTFQALTVILGDGNPPPDVLGYASAHIARWPSGVLREAPFEWTEALGEGSHVAAYCLCNSAHIADADVERFDAWLASPHLPDIKRLEVSDPAQPDTFMEKLVAHPRLTSLEELRLTSYDMDDDTFSLLARSSLRSLRVLELEDMDGGDVGVAAIVSSEVFAEVERFKVSSEYGDVCAQAARALATSPHVGALRALDLSGSELGDDAISMLSHASGLANLEELDVSAGAFGDVGLEALANATFAGNLRALDVSYNPVTAAGMLHIVTSSSWVKLERLGMDYIDLNDDYGGDVDVVWRALAEATGLGALRELLFDCDPTRASHVAHLIGSPTLPPELEIYVSVPGLRSPVRVGDMSDALAHEAEKT